MKKYRITYTGKHHDFGAVEQEIVTPSDDKFKDICHLYGARAIMWAKENKATLTSIQIEILEE